MNYRDFLIEVKTPWTKNNGVYERNIIQYNCIPGDIVDKPIFASRYLNEYKVIKEEKELIDKNELIIHAINKDTMEELSSPSELVNCLLEYTKFHWNYND